MEHVIVNVWFSVTVVGEIVMLVIVAGSGIETTNS